MASKATIEQWAEQAEGWAVEAEEKAKRFDERGLSSDALAEREHAESCRAHVALLRKSIEDRSE